MTATHPRSTAPPHIAAAPPWPRRAGTFLLQVLEGLGSYPSLWDPWLVLTPYRAVRRTVHRR
jgi:hypothetical protein